MPLGLGLLVVLAAVWAAVLLPSLLRSRVASSPIDGVRNFEQAMGILAGTRSNRRAQSASGRWVMVPKEVTAPMRRRSRVIQRRRRIFNRLAAVVVVTAAAGFVPSVRWVWFVHLGADAALALYVWRLLRWKREEDAAIAHSTQVRPPEVAEPVSQPAAGKVLPASVPPTPHAAPAEIGDDTLVIRTG